MNITDFYKFKKGQKISMITCYDYCTAKIISNSQVDSVLVGDSVAMTVYGYNSTVYATEEMIIRHTEAVKKGISDKKIIISDMPFLSANRGLSRAVETAGNLVKAGADAVKIENIEGHSEIIKAIIDAGIPVMGHLGLTPQYIKSIGGYHKRGKDKKEADKIIKDALRIEKIGCFSLILECVKEEISGYITEKLNIPVIGIGSGDRTDGQVIVINDILGLFPSSPSFVKIYENLDKKIIEAVNKFDADVKGEKNEYNKKDKWI